MDDSGHHENGRHKPPQGQWFMQHQPSMKQIMAMMAERDAALQERNLAISQKKAAMAERDLAILQRDSVISERNSALNVRDNAIAALQYRENTMTNGVKHVHRPQQHLHHHQQLHMDEAPYSSRDMHISDGIPMSPVPLEPAKSRQTKRTKEAKATAPKRKPSKSLKSVKREEGEDIGLKPNWKGQDLGLNQVAFDDSTMPVPVCSCTGILRPCYKWGNGGWQSSCCTTTMSMYPLPAVPNRRHARIGGRKMSGSAYNKLISRLTAEGHDLSNPVDLKDNWARHGTNRYITIK